MNQFDTITAALESAESQGFTESFKLENGKLNAIESSRAYTPGDMSIVDHHRFEGASSEGDASVLYLVECGDGTKGTIIDAFGTYANQEMAEFLHDVPVREGH